LALFGFAVLIGLPIACGYLHLPGGWIVNFPGMGAKAMSDDQMRQTLHVPDGFSINAYATGIENARMLLFTPTGDLLVSAPRTGTVWLVERDANGDGVADGTHELMSNLYQPHGLALHDGWLYVAETSAVLRVRFDPATRTVTGPPDRIITGLPDGGNHWTRTVHVGPDDKLYVSIGSSCNVCIESDKRRATIMRFDLDGKNGEIYATGLRNSVDFDWQPGTGAMYATDNGRDLLGDDFPPCELNKIVQGGFYGWPIANGDRVPDPDFGAGNDARIAASIPPAHPFGPHVAPLGMTFYRRPTGAAPAAFPADYDGVAFVAEHGSWNRSQKIGYQVVALRFAPDGTITETPFLTGFLNDEKVSGRPVDPAVGPDGALYVSDDYTGTVFRIASGAGAPAADAAPVAPPHGDRFAGLDAATIAAMQSRGAALWNAHPCAACHVAGQAAAGAYKPLENLTQRYTVDSLAAFLRTPQPPMPVFPFDDQQRRDLAVYLLKEHP
jgi:glucose/arabinose dehydrogenase